MWSRKQVRHVVREPPCFFPFSLSFWLSFPFLPPARFFLPFPILSHLFTCFPSFLFLLLSLSLSLSLCLSLSLSLSLSLAHRPFPFSIFLFPLSSPSLLFPFFFLLSPSHFPFLPSLSFFPLSFLFSSLSPFLFFYLLFLLFFPLPFLLLSTFQNFPQTFQGWATGPPLVMLLAPGLRWMHEMPESWCVVTELSFCCFYMWPPRYVLFDSWGSAPGCPGSCLHCHLVVCTLWFSVPCFFSRVHSGHWTGLGWSALPWQCVECMLKKGFNF